MAKKGKKITVKESGAWRNGTFGDDTITVTAKKDACVFGNKGNDTITVKKGSNHKICGDDKGESYYYSTYSGKDTITLAGGSRNQVWGGKGADKIYVEKGAGFATICGCEGNDTITVYKGAKAGKKSDYANIDGGTGNNTITVTNGKYYDIDTEEGSDTIKINGGSYYKIEDTGGKKNVISIKNASNFEVYTYPESKGAITISGGKNGSVTTYKTTVTVNSGSSHRVTAEGTKVIINGGKNLTITDDDWRKTNEKVTINGGSGTVAMGDGGKETVTIDFGNGKNKVGNWHILADYLTNNRLTVLGASSTEFSFERKWEEPGPSLILNDRWIMTNNSTGATITLEGWYSNWTKTFDIYFEKDNKLISSVPAKAEVDKLNLH